MRNVLLLSYVILCGADIFGTSTELVPTLTDANFDSFVNGNAPYFVQFMAPWCHYCKLLEPVWVDLARQLKGKTHFAKVDCTQSMALRARYQIMGFPTLLLFNNGQRLEFRGERSQSNLKAFLKRNHALSAGNLTLHATYYRGASEPIRLLLAELREPWTEKLYSLPPVHSPCYWRQTGDCDSKGPREPDHDRHCHSTVPAGASGYCECHDGTRGFEATCSHGELRCSTYCKDPNPKKKADIETFDADSWAEEGVVFAPGRELPFLMTAEAVPLRGTLAIMRTLARRNSTLYLPADVTEIEQLLAVTASLLRTYEALIDPPRAHTLQVNFRASLEGPANVYLSRVEKKLNAGFLVGGKFTLADIYAFHAISLLLGVFPACLENYPKTKEYFVDLGMRDALSGYLSSSRRLTSANSDAALCGNDAFPEDPAANPFVL